MRKLEFQEAYDIMNKFHTNDIHALIDYINENFVHKDNLDELKVFFDKKLDILKNKKD